MRPRQDLLAAILMLAASAALVASKPVFWQTATESDFLRGEVDNLSIDDHGTMELQLFFSHA